MLIDCDACAVRDVACGGCVVAVLLGEPGERRTDGASSAGDSGPTWDATDRRALHVLADAGLVPPLRHARRAG